jgi:hypothetical protein
VAPLLKQASPFFLSAPRSLAPGHGGGNQLQNSDFYPKLTKNIAKRSWPVNSLFGAGSIIMRPIFFGELDALKSIGYEFLHSQTFKCLEPQWTITKTRWSRQRIFCGKK